MAIVLIVSSIPQTLKHVLSLDPFTSIMLHLGTRAMKVSAFKSDFQRVFFNILWIKPFFLMNRSILLFVQVWEISFDSPTLRFSCILYWIMVKSIIVAVAVVIVAVFWWVHLIIISSKHSLSSLLLFLAAEVASHPHTRTEKNILLELKYIP